MCERLLLRPIAPEPAKGVRKNGGAVLRIVRAGAILKLEIIPREFQRRCHVLIGEWPVAMRVVQIVRALLEKDTDRLRFALRLTNEGRVTYPPRMLVKLPIQLTTLRNLSGRSHAMVNAAMPPLLIPAIAQPAGSSVSR